ncbi:hypothetical protein BH24ACT10_BH24ACT10_19730 [soil metagenome]
MIPMLSTTTVALVKRRAVDFCRLGSCLCPSS